MATAARDLGFEYIVICDHSQSAFYAGGMKPDALKAQMDEIDALKEKLKPFGCFTASSRTSSPTARSITTPRRSRGSTWWSAPSTRA